MAKGDVVFHKRPQSERKIGKSRKLADPTREKLLAHRLDEKHASPYKASSTTTLKEITNGKMYANIEMGVGKLYYGYTRWIYILLPLWFPC